ncbi:MAG: biopolymer transporter ExbD [Archangium sp.]|nr:biopolymer transporter ExbD [Archangium sp.]MDP3155331.1 biopolymer transporter ExbD [Archangium sp.]MDP3574785.1 biopolymer transporter ExbD [Archangium sp.]
MAFHFSRRKIKPKEEEEGGELNIVPYLDILMNLIIFMLLSMAGLATFGMLNVNAPNYGAGAGGGTENDKPALTLTVAVAKTGFFIAATGGVLPGQTEPSAAPGEGAPTIPRKADGNYDYDALTAKMMEIKANFPTESKVIIAAEADTDYDSLVSTMDATRETADRKLLFPDVTLASF